MTNNLLPFDRRMEIMFMLVSRRKLTRQELAEEFSVSDDVIDRDIVVLNKYIPLDITRGRYGGITLSKKYNTIKVYMNSDEEKLLKEYLQYANDTEKRLIKSILHKFSMPK